jgi:hypothetical protein
MIARALLVASLVAAAVPLAAQAGDAEPAKPAPPASRSSATSARPLAKKLGIRITALRLTAAGYMVDVRYRITDAGRASKTFLGRKHDELFLVDEATGMRFAVPTTPKLGALRQRPKGDGEADREYFVFFANPGRHLRAGDKVTLVAGNVRIPHLALE